MGDKNKEIAVLQSRVEALERELHQYRSVQRVGWTPHLFYLASLESGLVVYVSRSSEEILGIPSQHLRHWPGDWLKIIHPQDREAVRAATQQFAKPQTRPPRLEQEYRIIQPDGSLRQVLDRTHIIASWSGEPCWLVGMTRDVTNGQSTRS